MERRDIELFLTLAEELHFGRTGERLGISQGRVSQALRKIERRIGAPLFDRTSRRVALTPIGRQFHDELRPSYDGVRRAVERAVAAARQVSGSLRLGFEAPALADQLAAGLTRFRARCPLAELWIREAPFDDPLRCVRDGEVDALVTLHPVTETGLTQGPVVLVEPMMLAVSARHPLARRSSVSLEDLAAAPVLPPARPLWPYWRDPPDDWHTPDGRRIERGRRTGSFQELLHAVAAGDGVCPLGQHVARSFARPALAFVLFDDAPPARWGMTWAGRQPPLLPTLADSLSESRS